MTDETTPDEYDSADAVALAKMVADGTCAPAELFELAVSRIEATNPTINAVVRPMFDEAQAAIADGLPDGPFRGVPFLLKDLRAEYAGVPTTSGSRFFTEAVPQQDSELVARYKRAGMVILGKTNTPEFGGAPTTEGSLFGASRNPWDLERSPGGSSGGSSAAVAAGMVPAAHGSDGGGSIRIPASCTGLFGFKPSRGVNPAGPTYGEAWNGLSTEHVITRSVRDSAAILDVTAGPAPGDPYLGPTFGERFAAQLDRDPEPLTIAFQTATAAGTPAHPDCIAAVEDVARLLEDLGHRVVEARPSWDNAAAGSAFRLVVASNVNAAISRHAARIGHEPGPDDLEPINAILAAEAASASAADFVTAVWDTHAVGRSVAPFFEQHDVLLTPTVAAPPIRLGEIDITSSDVNDYLVKVFGWIPFTAFANQAGIPSMSVPLSWNDDGLPIGTCFTAGFGRDDLLFRLAGQLERARDWNLRRPPRVAP
jgi:Asp-tRNA(Asn)/Glu-tRNA(Gln) amidotransferase A subunit family amidase